MPDPKKPRAPKNSKPLTVGRAYDLCDRARDEHAQRLEDAVKRVERDLCARLESIVARVPDEERAHARQVCNVLGPDATHAVKTTSSTLEVLDGHEHLNRFMPERVDEIPPALLTEPEPVHAVEVDTATGKGRRTALGGGR
jgi:hypothetical protein